VAVAVAVVITAVAVAVLVATEQASELLEETSAPKVH
jgi:hypothetical protein